MGWYRLPDFLLKRESDLYAPDATQQHTTPPPMCGVWVVAWLGRVVAAPDHNVYACIYIMYVA